MRMLLIFLTGLGLSTFASYLLYKYYHINVPPSVGGLFLVFVWAMLPNKWTNKINGTNSDEQ